MTSGHSRIPIYEGNKNNIKGLLLVKRLIVVDPDDCRPLSQFVGYHLPIVLTKDTNLLDALNRFQMGRSHMAVIVNNKEDAKILESCMRDRNVQCPGKVGILGILTIEDVLEELIDEDIEDETDIAFATKEYHDDLKIVRRAAEKFKSLLKKKRDREAKYGIPEAASRRASHISGQTNPHDSPPTPTHLSHSRSERTREIAKSRPSDLAMRVLSSTARPAGEGTGLDSRQRSSARSLTHDLVDDGYESGPEALALLVSRQREQRKPRARRHHSVESKTMEERGGRKATERKQLKRRVSPAARKEIRKLVAETRTRSILNAHKSGSKILDVFSRAVSEADRRKREGLERKVSGGRGQLLFDAAPLSTALNIQTNEEESDMTAPLLVSKSMNE
ncbi:hypothetical protein AAMO2058_001685100 [Amorphochlora amoebiformis]